MLERITIDDLEYAIIMRSNYKSDGIEFFTSGHHTLQFGYMNRPTGYSIMPHIHKSHTRVIDFTCEVLLIKSGKVKVNFYDLMKKHKSSTILESGDVILLLQGGHGFEIIEAAEIIEVKQGPYACENDKVKFTG